MSARGVGHLTVLVADSQALFAEALSRVLAREPDLEVLEPRPQSGVQAAQAGVVCTPSVAVLDFWLVGITGVGAAQSILAKSPDTKVILLGWFHRPQQVTQAFDAGAAGFVSKSVTTVELVTAIRRVAAGERLLIDGGDTAPTHGTEARSTSDHRRQFGKALTPRELEVLRLLGAGFPVEDVGARLGITRETARRHVTAILAKTGTHSQVQALAVARRHGLLA